MEKVEARGKKHWRKEERGASGFVWEIESVLVPSFSILLFSRRGSLTFFHPFLAINLLAGISFEIKYNIGPWAKWRQRLSVFMTVIVSVVCTENYPPLRPFVHIAHPPVCDSLPCTYPNATHTSVAKFPQDKLLENSRSARSWVSRLSVKYPSRNDSSSILYSTQTKQRLLPVTPDLLLCRRRISSNLSRSLPSDDIDLYFWPWL